MTQPPEFYGAARLNPTTLAHLATSADSWREILSFHDQLASDEYVAYVDRYYRDCMERFGADWFYLDIVNVLYAAAKALRPKRYLEIGVRRGRTVCTVARAHPEVEIVASDMWIEGYAGMDNPGPEWVREELLKSGHRGEITFLNGDSHQLVPRYLQADTERRFDLITVDGDHSTAGAREDLLSVIPHLAVGGVLVFDDIAHPAHPELRGVWRECIDATPGLLSYEFTEAGYGVGFAIKMRER